MALLFIPARAAQRRFSPDGGRDGTISRDQDQLRGLLSPISRAESPPVRVQNLVGRVFLCKVYRNTSHEFCRFPYDNKLSRLLWFFFHLFIDTRYK
jgi:hypothetical protein